MRRCEDLEGEKVKTREGVKMRKCMANPIFRNLEEPFAQARSGRKKKGNETNAAM